MAEINLSDSRGRDARVATRSVNTTARTRWLDNKGRQVVQEKVLRSVMDCDFAALIKRFGDGETLAQEIVKGDPELDIERQGSFLRNTSRVYIGPDRKVVFGITQYEVVRGPDGAERERRPRKIAESNTAAEIPLRWTGKLMNKSQAYNRFVFSGAMQVQHVNGLTYDFLYAMAKELHEKDSLMLLGAGPKGAEPLIFRRGGAGYRGFLEGRIQGEKYALILHLSNMELKAPAQPAPSAQPAQPAEPKTNGGAQ